MEEAVVVAAVGRHRDCAVNFMWRISHLEVDKNMFIYNLINLSADISVSVTEAIACSHELAAGIQFD